MKNILILGANGRVARIVRDKMQTKNDVHLTLFLRNASRIKVINNEREQVIEGDVNDSERLDSVMKGQDVVYANLVGDMERMATNIVSAMSKHHVHQLIWVTGSGLYHETPEPFGSWVEKTVGHETKENTRRAAKVIEGSSLNYTIIRAAYMTDDKEINYELTHKGELFKGTMVSRASIANLVVTILDMPQSYSRMSLGIAKPGTEHSMPPAP
ncbi:NAD(P)H-binding protein [Secundilactobacillus similis]|nr:NAD(P)H-binding protein [Secundilactobacillus similis]